MCFLKVVSVVLSHFKIAQECVTQDISNGLDNPGIYLKLFKCFWAPENKYNNKYMKLKGKLFVLLKYLFSPLLLQGSMGSPLTRPTPRSPASWSSPLTSPTNTSQNTLSPR